MKACFMDIRMTGHRRFDSIATRQEKTISVDLLKHVLADGSVPKETCMAEFPRRGYLAAVSYVVYSPNGRVLLDSGEHGKKVRLSLS